MEEKSVTNTSAFRKDFIAACKEFLANPRNRVPTDEKTWAAFDTALKGQNAFPEGRSLDGTNKETLTKIFNETLARLDSKIVKHVLLFTQRHPNRAHPEIYKAFFSEKNPMFEKSKIFNGANWRIYKYFRSTCGDGRSTIWAPPLPLEQGNPVETFMRRPAIDLICALPTKSPLRSSLESSFIAGYRSMFFSWEEMTQSMAECAVKAVSEKKPAVFLAL